MDTLVNEVVPKADDEDAAEDLVVVEAGEEGIACAVVDVVVLGGSLIV